MPENRPPDQDVYPHPPPPPTRQDDPGGSGSRSDLAQREITPGQQAPAPEPGSTPRPGPGPQTYADYERSRFNRPRPAPAPPQAPAPSTAPGPRPAPRPAPAVTPPRQDRPPVFGGGVDLARGFGDSLVSWAAAGPATYGAVFGAFGPNPVSDFFQRGSDEIRRRTGAMPSVTERGLDDLLAGRNPLESGYVDNNVMRTVGSAAGDVALLAGTFGRRGITAVQGALARARPVPPPATPRAGAPFDAYGTRLLPRGPAPPFEPGKRAIDLGRTSPILKPGAQWGARPPVARPAEQTRQAGRQALVTVKRQERKRRLRTYIDPKAQSEAERAALDAQMQTILLPQYRPRRPSPRTVSDQLLGRTTVIQQVKTVQRPVTVPQSFRTPRRVRRPVAVQAARTVQKPAAAQAATVVQKAKTSQKAAASARQKAAAIAGTATGAAVGQAALLVPRQRQRQVPGLGTVFVPPVLRTPPPSIPTPPPPPPPRIPPPPPPRTPPTRPPTLTPPQLGRGGRRESKKEREERIRRLQYKGNVLEHSIIGVKRGPTLVRGRKAVSKALTKERRLFRRSGRRLSL